MILYPDSSPKPSEHEAPIHQTVLQMARSPAPLNPLQRLQAPDSTGGGTDRVVLA